MAYDKFLIGFSDDNASLQTDVRPWLIADNAFTILQNAYVFRGRVRKRFGSRFMGTGYSSAQTQPLFSRLAIALYDNMGNPVVTDGSGDAMGTIPGTVITGRIGMAFSIGNVVYTVYQTGNPANMYATTATTTATYDTTSGAYVFAGAPINTQVFFYPALPVMGITQYEVGAINDHATYAFDTQFAYVFAGGFWNLSGNPAAGTVPIWHGSNINFFWTCNWDYITPNQTALFASNFYVKNINGAADATDDPIWYTPDGTNWYKMTTNANSMPTPTTPLPYTIFNSAGDYIVTSRIVLPFKNRLILLNTIESDGTDNTNYVNRCRYSINGSPFAQTEVTVGGDNAYAPYAWLETNQTFTQTVGGATAVGIAQGAGYLDAPTEEAIISAEFIRDRLVVFFERSTWELVYTFNDELPFVWQRINTELGSEAQQSAVPFDKVVLTVGNTGVHACSGATVERVDNKIPDQVFEILDKNIATQRVAGIRDYYVEMVYWTFPADNQPSGQIYPARVLIYNYKTGSWALNNDCITSFGYFEQQDGMTWASSSPITWQEANFTWNSGTVEANFRQVIAGNQQGFMFIIDPDFGRNANAMQITNLTITNGIVTLTIIDHTLTVGDYISVENAGGITITGTQFIYRVASADNTTFAVVIQATNISGTYTGGGTAARVSQIQIQSKQWNPYNSSKNPSQNLYLAKIDFGVLRTDAGQVTVDYFDASTEIEQINNEIPGINMGNNILETTPYSSSLYPMEQYQTRLWHSVYFQATGNCVQIEIFMSDAQTTDSDIAWSDFQLDGLILNTQRSGRLQ